MKKINSLILLINSLSKAEKKAIHLHSNLTRGEKMYMELFKLVDANKIVDSSELQKEFKQRFSKASFHPVASYLYDFILNVLARIKSNQHQEFAILQKLMSAKVLEERNLDTEYYDLLQQLKEEATTVNNYNLLLAIQRMELDFLQTHEFLQISEQELLKKQHKTTETLKVLRQINEQSSLYELLLLRAQETHQSQKETQKQFMNDLVVSEISLVSNLNRNVFEVQKLHQLFQAEYLMYVGDYKSALNSFIELDKLFTKYKEQWHNPPMYYARVLEGILGSLRGVKQYSKMQYFIDQLAELAALNNTSLSFQAEIACMRFVYTLVPHLETGSAKECLKIVKSFEKELFAKMDLLTPYRYLQLCLYASVAYFSNKEYVIARKQMTHIINGDSYTGLSPFRPMQLVNLAIHYELGDVDIITSRVRSIKRQNRMQKYHSDLENIIFHFMGINLLSQTTNKIEQLEKKINNAFEHIKETGEERRLIAIFDFKDWMLKHIAKNK